MEGLSPADVAAMQKDDGFFGGDGMIILLLFILMLGGGFGGYGCNRDGGAFTRAEMADGFNMSNLQNDVKANTGTLNCGFAEVNRNIDQSRYEAAQNTCAIKTAIHEDGEATRALITANTIQDLRDKLQQKDNELQSAQLALANGVQTQNILNAQGRYVPYAGCGSCCNGNVFSGFNGNVW